VRSNPAISQCRSCHANVIVVVTINGKETRVNAEPDAEKGNMVLLRAKRLPLALVISNLNEQAREAAKREGVPLFLSHFATCPDSEQWRR
jgi:hypothetical protein